MDNQKIISVPSGTKKTITITDDFFIKHPTVKNITFRVYKDATLRCFFAFQNSKVVTIKIVLQDSGADAQLIGGYCGSMKDRFEITTIQHHQAPHTSSSVMIKAIMVDQAQAHVSGTIIVDKIAQKTESSLYHKTVALGAGSVTVSEPQLEIIANDVRCNHGSALSTLDSEELFYLQSRGIERTRAIKLLLRAFFSDIHFSDEHMLQDFLDKVVF